MVSRLNDLSNTHESFFSHVVAALLVLDDVIGVGLAAGEWHTAGLARPQDARCTVEVAVGVPVGWRVDAATLPRRLDVIDEILLVRILAVVEDEVPQSDTRFVLDPAAVFQGAGEYESFPHVVSSACYSILVLF